MPFQEDTFVPVPVRLVSSQVVGSYESCSCPLLAGVEIELGHVDSRAMATWSSAQTPTSTSSSSYSRCGERTVYIGDVQDDQDRIRHDCTDDVVKEGSSSSYGSDNMYAA